MLGMDFEPSNSHLLAGKMFNGRDARIVYVKRRPKPQPKPEKRINMQGSYKEPDGKTSYPASKEKKIFGMKPKTLAIAVGVIIVSIWVLKQTGSREASQIVGNGGVVG